MKRLISVLTTVAIGLTTTTPVWAAQIYSSTDSVNSSYTLVSKTPIDISDYAVKNNVNVVVYDQNNLLSKEYHSDGLVISYDVNPINKQIQKISNSQGVTTTITQDGNHKTYTTYNSGKTVKSYSVEKNISKQSYNLSTENIKKAAQSNNNNSNNTPELYSDYIEDGYNLSNMIPSVWTVAAGNDKFGRPRTAMTEAEIQEYFEDKNSVLQDSIDVWAFDANGDLYDTGRTVIPSKVISDASKDYSINPKVLLGKLQGESSLVYTQTAEVNTRTFAYCMGYNATDSGDILTGTGFDQQVENAARMFLHHWNTAYEMGESSLPYYFNNLDTDIYVNNCGTYALFQYTPWVSSNLLLAKVFKMMFPGNGQNGVDWN